MDRNAILNEFVAECKTNKTLTNISDAIEVRDDGIFATAPIESGECLLSVPFSRCISVDRVLASVLKPIFDDNPGLLDYPDEILALGLMYGITNEDCPWHGHCRSMPQTIDSLIFWDDASRERLKGFNNFFISKMLSAQIEQDWSNIHAPLVLNYESLLGDVKFDHYKWALSMVYSRAIGIQKDGQYTRCMAPVIDMANHSPLQGKETADVFHFNDQTITLELHSCIDRKDGDECFAVYGPYSNSKLLHTYGFVLPGEVPLAIDIWPNLSVFLKKNPDGAYKTLKIKLLDKLDLMSAAARYDFSGSLRADVGGHNIVFHPDLLNMVRIMQASEDEMKEKGGLDYNGGVISTRNEVATYRAILGLLETTKSRLDEELSHLIPVSLPGPQSNISDIRERCAKTVREEDCLLLDVAIKEARKHI
jgi:hypothetical protein